MHYLLQRSAIIIAFIWWAEHLSMISGSRLIVADMEMLILAVFSWHQHENADVSKNNHMVKIIMGDESSNVTL